MDKKPILKLAHTLLIFLVALSSVTVTYARPVQHPARVTLNLTQYVDPFIGTDIGGTNPAAALPFGMIQFGPDTTDHRYHYPDNTIVDFSLTHMSGAGCTNKGDVPFMPITGALPSTLGSNWNAAGSLFSHTNETAAPGYYRVNLSTYNIQVETTATARTGFARLTYPATTQASLLFNVSKNNNLRMFNGSINIVGNNQVTGLIHSSAACTSPQTVDIYFVVQFDRSFTGYGTWLGDTITPGSTSSSGQPAGGYVTFDTTSNPLVQMKVGLSYVSLANAQQNLSTENPAWDFTAIRTAADTAWNNALNRVQISGGSATDLKKFYTGLYHSFYTPNINSDLNGQYLGFDNAVHTASGRVVYQNYSGWDVYRNWFQLVAMLAPESLDMVKTMIADGQEGVAMPLWSDANKELRVMIGDPSTVMVANAYAFGVRNFDTAAALTLMDQSATNSSRSVRGGISDWWTLHYYVGNAANTLEYATADFAISQLALAVGDTAKYDKYSVSAQNWKNNWNPASGYIHPRNRDGTWLSPFDPTSTNGYVEGNASIYTWMVPYNLQGLFTLMGGNATAISRLDTYTSQYGNQQSGFLDIGNEPSAGEPWAYNSAQAPWKTQDLVRRTVNQKFAAAPAGYPGDDDLGAMSSWVVWAYLGMYPMIPGTDILVFNGPYFPSATITLANGNALTINATGAGAGNQYIQSLTVNGVPATRNWIHFSEISGGATLNFSMGSAASSWGSGAGDVPPSFDTNPLPTLTPTRTPTPGPSSTPTVTPTGGPSSTSTSTRTPTAVATQPPGDLAWNQPATASASCNSNEAAPKAVNGSWTGGNSDKWCDNTSASKWWQVDLGQTYSLTQFVIYHAGAGGESTTYNTKDFNLQVSTNGTSWTTVVTVTGNSSNVTTHNIAATSARYVRLNVTAGTQGTSTTARIYEVEVYGASSPTPTPTNTPPPGTNLALNKPATASASCNANEGPEKAVNGSWTGGNSDKWCDNTSASKWLQVDLGGNFNVNQFVIRHAGAGGESTTWNTRDFTIQVSTDGVNWTTVVTVSGNTASITTHNITTTTARFVRLNVTTPTQTTDTAARIYELEVYGN